MALCQEDPLVEKAGAVLFIQPKVGSSEDILGRDTL